MGVSIHQLTDFFAHAPIRFFDIYAPVIPPGGKQLNWKTNKNGAGLVFPLAGRSQYTLGKTPYVLEPGVILHAGPNIPISKEVIGDTYWQYALVHYQIPEAQTSKFSIFNEHFIINTGANTRLTDLIDQLRQSYTAPGSIAELKCKVLFLSLLEEIAISAKRQLDDNSTELMAQAVDYIHQGYAGSISIAKISNQFGLERRRFSYLFEKHTGMSPINYLTEYRIRQAKELLRTSGCSISLVAESVGYTDSFYFSRLFKRQTGLSPTEFRQMVTEKSWNHEVL